MARSDEERRRLRSAQEEAESLIAILSQLADQEPTARQIQLIAAALAQVAQLTLDVSELWRLHDREYTKGRTRS